MIFTPSLFSGRDFGFSPTDYSKFKFGCGKTAKAFARILADKIITHTNYYENLVVVCSPYQNIPTASAGLTKYLVAALNLARTDMELKPVQELKMYREKSYVRDYGTMSEDERSIYIAGDLFHLDIEFLQGKHVLFVDDIRITGAHEKVVENYVKNSHANFSYDFCYYAVMEGKGDPTVEHYLNHCAIDTLADLAQLVLLGNHILNVRTIKKLLSASVEDIRHFLFIINNIDFVCQLCEYIYADSYHLVPEYKAQVAFIRTSYEKLSQIFSFI